MRAEIAEVLRTVFQLDDSFVLEGTMSYDDVPGWDSVGHMNLVNELESRYDIILEIDEIVELGSVMAIEEMVTRKRNA